MPFLGSSFFYFLPVLYKDIIVLERKVDVEFLTEMVVQRSPGTISCMSLMYVVLVVVVDVWTQD